MRELTNEQREMLKTIKDYIDNKGYSPSVRELCELLGKRSTATIHYHLKNLAKKGYISYQERKGRTIRVIEKGE